MSETVTTGSPDGPGRRLCSAKGCRAPAAHDLQWNNPKIHPPDRRKHWLACAEHRDTLAAFLSARGFLRSVDELPDQHPVNPE